jgi:hypothetical protein
MKVTRHSLLLSCRYSFTAMGALSLCYWATATVGARFFQVAELRRFNEDVKTGQPTRRSAEGP